MAAPGPYRPLGEKLVRLIDELDKRRNERARQFIADVSSSAELSQDEVEQCVLDDERLEEVMWAARRAVAS